MPLEQWQFAFVLGIVLSHAAIAAGFYWLRRDRGTVAGAARSVDSVETAEIDGFVITCPECEAENESGYRYCRNCVAELPGSMDFGSDGDAPVGRLIR